MKKKLMSWKVVMKRYSFIAHILIAISSVAPLLLPIYDYLPTWAMFTLIGLLALFGVVGSFINQSIKGVSCDRLDKE